MAGRGLGALTLDLILRMGGFEQGMDKAARVADKRMREIEKRAKVFGAVLGAAVATAGAAALVGIKNAIDYADKLNDMNQRLGVSAEALSGWGYAAKQTGTDIDALGIGLKKLAKSMADSLDPKSDQARIFEALGVSVKDAAGNLRSVEDVLPEIATKFKELDNATLESALSMELFGKSGTDLIEFLNQGEDGLSDLRDRARELGVELSGSTLKAADEFNDTLGDIKTIVDGLWAKLAAELLPVLVDVAKQLRDGAKDGGDFASIFGFIANQARAALKDIAFFIKTARELKALYDSFGDEKAQERSWLPGAQDYYKTQHMFDNVTGGSQTSQRQGRFSAEYEAASLNFNPGSSALEGRVTAALGARPTGGGSKRKSDAAREAEALAKAYASANARLTEQIALVGSTTEAQRAYFEVTQGSLAALAPAEKQQYVLHAQELDLANARNKAMEDEADAARRAADEKKDGIKYTADMIESMQFELKLLGLTNAEREREIALRQAGTFATEEQKAAILDLTDALVKGHKEQAFWENFQSSLSDSFYDLATGAKSLKDAIGDFFDSIAKNITRAIADSWSEKITGLFQGSSSGDTSGGGNWFGSLLGALLGGGEGKASGGGVQANSLHRVNEYGTEMFSAGGKDYLMTGSRGGFITPAHAMGGRSGPASVNQTFVVSGRMDSRTAAQMAQHAATESRRASTRNA